MNLDYLRKIDSILGPIILNVVSVVSTINRTLFSKQRAKELEATRPSKNTY